MEYAGIEVVETDQLRDLVMLILNRAGVHQLSRHDVDFLAQGMFELGARLYNAEHPIALSPIKPLEVVL